MRGRHRICMHMQCKSDRCIFFDATIDATPTPIDANPHHDSAPTPHGGATPASPLTAIARVCVAECVAERLQVRAKPGNRCGRTRADGSRRDGRFGRRGRRGRRMQRRSRVEGGAGDGGAERTGFRRRASDDDDVRATLGSRWSSASLAGDARTTLTVCAARIR